MLLWIIVAALIIVVVGAWEAHARAKRRRKRKLEAITKKLDQIESQNKD
jgi:cytochrome c-type biogenesis protein CcmH/NrfF